MNIEWIPITTRPMDEKERELYRKFYNGPFSDEEFFIYTNRMPEDGQEILVSFKSGYVDKDICSADYDGELQGFYYGLEDHGDWDGVAAWMPMPEPYEE